jgi:hypothetical protein
MGEYNGWSNYATWRVNVELCEDIVSRMLNRAEYGDLEPGWIALAGVLRRECETVVDYGKAGSAIDFAQAFARAFLAQVNWREIAEHNGELLDAILKAQDQPDDDDA